MKYTLIAIFLSLLSWGIFQISSPKEEEEIIALDEIEGELLTSSISTTTKNDTQIADTNTLHENSTTFTPPKNSETKTDSEIKTNSEIKGDPNSNLEPSKTEMEAQKQTVENQPIPDNSVEVVVEKQEKKSLPKKEGKENEEKEKGYDPMSFQFLSSFDISDDLNSEEIKKVPDYVKELEGKIIGIPGFMIPTDMTQTTISKFLLVNMNDNCCFGGTPKITEFIFAETTENIKYTNFPIAIIGELTINKNFEEKILYRMNVHEVISARDSAFWDIMKNAPKFPEVKEGPYSYGNSFYNQE